MPTCQESRTEAVEGFRGQPAWQPGLARSLLVDFEDGLTSENAARSSSERDDPSTNSVASLPLCRFRLQPDGWQSSETEFGFSLVGRLPSDAERGLIDEAMCLLSICPSLAEAVQILVRDFYLIQSPGIGYDVSHSQPDLPFSIFVTIPVGERDAAERLAESILHEAMHLQLSILERYVPLVNESLITGYSPWQRKERPIGGLVHGLFVFRVIDQWLAQIITRAVNHPESLSYARRRRIEIAEEIGQLGQLSSSSALTPEGRRRVAFWLAPQLPGAAAR